MRPRLALAALALACVCALQLMAMLLAPPRHLPHTVTLRLAPGESLVLGRTELAAPRAASRQFTLRRDAGGLWWLRNTNPAQAAVLLRGEERLHSGSVALAAGQRLQAGAAFFDVVAAQDSRPSRLLVWRLLLDHDRSTLATKQPCAALCAWI